MDLFRGRPIVFAFCLPQHDRTMLIPKFKSVLLLRSWQSHFMRPHPLRQETSGLIKNSLIAVSDPQRSIFHGLVDIQPDQQCIVLAAQINHSSEVCPGNSAYFANRHPVLGETYRLPGLKKCVSLLVAEQAALHFHIRAIVIGKCLAPIEAIGIDAPRPNFLRW